MQWMIVDPVGLPALAVMATAMLVFVIFVILARSRRGVEAAGGSRLAGSWGGVAIQGIGIGSAGFGPIAIGLDPLSAKALVEATVVAALMGLACWLFFASSRAMGKNWAIVARTRADHQLVTNGPFSLVRNPIYFALFLFMVALAISYGHTRNLLIGVPLFALGTWIRVAHEERLLRAQFGADFDAYAARVKRFVPGLF